MSDMITVAKTEPAHVCNTCGCNVDVTTPGITVCTLELIVTDGVRREIIRVYVCEPCMKRLARAMRDRQSSILLGGDPNVPS